MKRAIAAMLALVLSLGVVAPTWAEETGEEDVVLQATGETYDAGEDTAAPMMMLAARGAAATAASTGLDCTKGVAAGKIKEKFTDYVNHAMQYYIDNVSELREGKSILFFFEGVSAEASSDYKAYKTTDATRFEVDYSRSVTRNAAVCLAVKFVNGVPEIYYCENESSTIPDRPLNFDYEEGLAPSIISDVVYKIIRDNKDGEYAAFRIDPSEDKLGDRTANVIRMYKTGEYQTERILPPHGRNSWYHIHGRGGVGTATTAKNSFSDRSTGCILVGSRYTSFTNFMNVVTGIDCTNPKLSKPRTFTKSEVGSFDTDYSYMVIDRSQYQAELTDLYTGKTTYNSQICSVSSAQAAAAVKEICATSMVVKEEFDKQPACPYAPHEAGATLADGTSKFKTIQKDGVWVAACKGCGVVYDYMASFNTGDAGVYEVVDATGDGLCSAPYKEASISPLAVGNKVTVIGSVKNAYDNKWMQTADGWIYSGKLKRVENAPTIVNSGYCGGEGDGTNLSWTLDSEGLLTISGRGKMFYDFSFKGWENQRDDVREVIIQQGVTTVADGAFAKSHNLANVTLPDSISFIGSSAFYYTALTSITIPDGVEGIGQFAFEGCADLTDVYYGGTRAQWDTMAKYYIGHSNEPLMSANIHFLATGATVRPGTGAKQEVKAGADGKMAITVPNVVNNKAATVTFDQAAVENISGYGDMTLTVKDNTANLSGTLKNSAEVKGKNAASIIVSESEGAPTPTPGTGTTTSGHGQAASSGASGAKITSAETFDPGVGVYAVTAVLSLTGMAWIRRKRR